MILAIGWQLWGALMYSFLWTTIGALIIWVILIVFSSINKHWKIKNLTEK